MKLSVPFTVLNQLKIDHWLTKSYAEHKALEKAYEAFDDLFDKLVEAFFGKTSIPSDNIQYTIKSESYNNDLINRYTQMRVSVINYLRDFVSTPGMEDIKNIVDEIEGEFNVLIYRLNQK